MEPQQPANRSSLLQHEGRRLCGVFPSLTVLVGASVIRFVFWCLLQATDC